MPYCNTYTHGRRGLVLASVDYMSRRIVCVHASIAQIDAELLWRGGDILKQSTTL